ncbi:MAG: hypothetical protein KKI07_03525, partial [Euryarchaeota archaeon]|nr:hypothetical protein [Euryarchaeota archaeon]
MPMAVGAVLLPYLEISAPKSTTVGEEITITVTSEGNVVEGVTVLINEAIIGTTDSNGQIKHTFDKIGIYLITATKLGYTPAVTFTITITEIIEGAAFTVPDSLEDEISEYRKVVPEEIPT